MKKTTLRLLCLFVAAILSLALIACTDNNGDDKPADSSTESKASVDDAQNSDTEADKGDTSETKADEGGTSDTEATAPETKEPLKIGDTGLRAVNGTVPTYLSFGKQEHKNLKLGNVYGIVANVDGALTSVNLYTATYDADNGDQMTIKVFNWNTDYATSVAGEAVASVTITGYPNGGWYMITFEQALPAGEYVIEISGTSDGDDYGTAIWIQNASPFIMTYENGEEMDDGGVWAQLIVE